MKIMAIFMTLFFIECIKFFKDSFSLYVLIFFIKLAYSKFFFYLFGCICDT